MNFWLAVLAGISDLELVFGFHSSHVVQCHWICKKRFPIYHACPKSLAAYRCGSAFPENGLAFRQDFEKVGKTLVDW